jgi:hypothetical protein
LADSIHNCLLQRLVTAVPLHPELIVIVCTDRIAEWQYISVDGVEVAIDATWYLKMLEVRWLNVFVDNVVDPFRAQLRFQIAVCDGTRDYSQKFYLALLWVD